jgi:hypothetical protein
MHEPIDIIFSYFFYMIIYEYSYIIKYNTHSTPKLRVPLAPENRYLYGKKGRKENLIFAL